MNEKHSNNRKITMLTYADLILRLTDWASQTPDIRAALILGSQARSDHPADEWSDLDLLVFTHNIQKFLQSGEWAFSIAPAWLSFVEPSGDGTSWERRTLYQNGLDVDVAFFPAEILTSIRQAIPADIADVIRRGVKPLVDKDGQLAEILMMPLPASTLYRKPSEQEFINETSNFWYHTLWSVKHLRRGELWWGKSCVDSYLKDLVRKMLEWHAHAIKGEQFDTWLRGRFLDEWADPRAVAQLGEAFAHYEARDTGRALRATMNLYRWLEDETASRWKYHPPREGEHQAAEAALQLLEDLA
jgi:aminoglycoside 6-adenylyltransferase